MIIDVKKIPKKLNEFNYFEKNENGGCTLYSYGLKSDMVIVCGLNDFTIDKDFCVDDKAVEMLKILSPIKEINICNTFIIKSKKGNYSAKLIDSSNFSKPKMNFENSFEADFSRLKIASSFCAINDKKPILTGINVNSNGDINATDSFVAYRYINKENIGNACHTITIPKDFIEFIGRNVDIDNEVVIDFNNNTCMIQIDNIKYISRLLDGQYPNLNRVFDAKINSQILEFDSQDLKEKVNISKNLGVADKDTPIYITFTNDKMGAIGQNDFACDLENKTTRFNYAFTVSINNLNCVLPNLKNEKVVVYYNDVAKPIFIEENENEFLILPVRR